MTHVYMADTYTKQFVKLYISRTYNVAAVDINKKKKTCRLPYGEYRSQ